MAWASIFNRLITFNHCSLWEFCNAAQSHIGEVVVPLLLHCITLPSGSDTFWKVVQDDFQHTDWRVRFTAGKYHLQLIITLHEHVASCNLMPCQPFH